MSSDGHTEPEARKSIADWLLEVSALLAVFPWLDQLIFHPKGSFDWPLTMMAVCTSGGLGGIGLGLVVRSRHKRIVFFTVGGLLLMVGFLIFSRR